MVNSEWILKLYGFTICSLAKQGSSQKIESVLIILRGRNEEV
jgi:hypothetical protein